MAPKSAPKQRAPVNGVTDSAATSTSTAPRIPPEASPYLTPTPLPPQTLIGV